MSELYSWQKPASAKLTRIMCQYQVALDASDTGVGKTYVALDVMRQGGLVPLVVCPKAAIPSWYRVSKELGIPVQDVVNPEKLKTGRTPYLGKGGKKQDWIWASKVDALIFDECHKFGGAKSQNAWIMAASKTFQIPSLNLSATVADSPLKLRALGYLLGLHQFRDFWAWTKRYGCYSNPWGGVAFTTDIKRRSIALLQLHRTIFPDKGIRLRVDQIPGFPENAVSAEAFELSDKATHLTQEAYADAEDELSKAEDEETPTNPLVILLRACQQAELNKVDLLTGIVEDTLEEGRSPVVFTRFRATQVALARRCEEIAPGQVALIHGSQNDKTHERELEIARFQSNEKTVMLAMIQAGGLAISLHDLHGRPRSSFICPVYNVVELKQALGRIHRAASMSKAIQKIVFAAGTVEEEVCKAVRRKLDNLEMLNDGELQGAISWMKK